MQKWRLRVEAEPVSSEATAAPSTTVDGDDKAPANVLAGLRRFVRPRPARERCDLCAADLAEQHQHLFAPADRKLACACDACAVLFSGRQSGRYRLVPRRGEFWQDFLMKDADWEALNIPINMAFFCRSADGAVVAFYPSPAGATESTLPAEAWQELLAANPRLAELQPDVEALLVNRVGMAREYYRAPIDECYRLVGLIRANWRGLSGGKDVWRAIGEFFAELKRKSKK